MNFAGKARGKCVTGVGHKVQLPLGPSTGDAFANWELAGCLRRRRLAFPTGKVARPLAVTDESQNAAYFLQPNWNGSIVHPPAHKQSRFQLARLAARATLPAREGKCALRAQDAHLYKSQFGGVVAAYRLPLPLGEVPAGRRGPSQSWLTPCQLPQRGSQGGGPAQGIKKSRLP